jgi:hypothetical protein
MVDLLTVAGGLLVALLLVGAVLYLTIGRDIEWDEPTDTDSGDRVSEIGVED